MWRTIQKNMVFVFRLMLKSEFQKCVLRDEADKLKLHSLQDLRYQGA
jgi:hypothetical protein